MFLQIMFAADSEREFLSGLQIQRHTEVAGADGRALRVHHDADELAACGGGGANIFDGQGPPIVKSIPHVEAENIDARFDKLADHFGGIRGWAERGDDFSSADDASLHGESIQTGSAITSF